MKNTPAFPRTAFNANGAVTTSDSEFHGMSLRDYFAAKAMQGMLSILIANDSAPYFDVIAHDAYKQADAMLKVRGEE
jgi:hypothetical protein